MTFPRSIAAGTPAFWSSPTIGPGLNGVSPSRTQMSSGARSPPRAGAFVFVASISLYRRNGLIAAVTTAVWSWTTSTRPSSPFFFEAASFRASRRRLFLETFRVARPMSRFRIAWNCGAGMPRMFTIPITGARSNSCTRPFTASIFRGATWAIVTASQVPHGGAHRRLHVGRLDVEPPALELPEDAPHQEVEVLRDVLRGHVPGPDRGVERALVPGADPHRAPHGVDLARRIRTRRDGSRHLAAGAEHDAEPLPDHGHQRGLRDEEVESAGELLRLLLVPRVRFDLLGLDAEVRGPRLLRHLAGAEDADPHGLPASLRQHDLLVEAVLRDGQVDVPQVDGDLHGLLELSLRGRLEGLPDRLDRLLLCRTGHPL